MAVSEKELIQAFVRKLGLLCDSGYDPSQLDAKAGAYADMLAGKFPREIYTRETLEDCYRRFTKKLPALGELEHILSLWVSVHRVRANPAITSRVNAMKAIAYGEKTAEAPNETNIKRIAAITSQTRRDDNG